MIANRWQIRKARREARRKRFSEMGKASARARDQKQTGREMGPRSTPYGELLKTAIFMDPKTGEVNRYDIFKSYAGKRKIDLWVNRDTSREKWILGVSATWFASLMRQHLAHLPEIQED